MDSIKLRSEELHALSRTVLESLVLAHENEIANLNIDVEAALGYSHRLQVKLDHHERLTDDSKKADRVESVARALFAANMKPGADSAKYENSWLRQRWGFRKLAEAALEAVFEHGDAVGVEGK